MYGGNITVGVGVYTLGDIGGHLVIGITDDKNGVIAEFNGLATGPGGQMKAMGFPWEIDDLIKAYPGITEMYADSDYKVELGKYTVE